MRGPQGAIDHGRAAASRRILDRGPDADARSTNSEAHLAAIRHLFDWLVTGQVIPINPAALVRGPSHVVRQGKATVLKPAEARELLDSIDVSTHAGLRDRALIAMMVYSFARAGARSA